MTLSDCIPNVTRVRTPQGWVGLVIRVSPTRRWSVLVALSDGSVRAFAPEELTKVEPDKATLPAQVLP